jgi:hypothetical protein
MWKPRKPRKPRRAGLALVAAVLLGGAVGCESGGQSADPAFCTDAGGLQQSISELRTSMEAAGPEGVRQASVQLVETLEDLAERAPGDVDGALAEYRDQYTQSDEVLAGVDYDVTRLSSAEREQVVDPELGDDAAEDVEEFLGDSCG